MSIESALLDLGSAIEYTETPDFAAPAPRRLPVKWAVAAAVVLIALVSLLVPAVRDQVAAWLGIRGLTIERTDSVDPLHEPSLRVEFGEPTTLDASAVPFAPVVLPALGTPDAVYVDSEDRLTMVYVVDDQPVLLTQFLGDLNPAIVKQVEAETEVEAATVNGRAGDLGGLWAPCRLLPGCERCVCGGSGLAGRAHPSVGSGRGHHAFRGHHRPRPGNRDRRVDCPLTAD